MGKIFIIGLGPTDESMLTKKALEAMEKPRRNFLRTDHHETKAYFKKQGLAYQSFDHLYEELDSFAEIYETIYDHLVSAREEGDINYFVPGSPLIAEKTVKLLMERLDPKDYEIIQGLSFIEPVLALVKADPVEGFHLIDGDQFHWTDFNFHVNTLVTQVYNQRILTDLKLSLGEIYGDDHVVSLIIDAGLETESVQSLPVYQIDRLEVNHQTSLFVPKLEGLRKNEQDLAKLMERLRSRNGCPWDLAQTHESITDNLLEEAYEAVDAIREGDLDHMVEELGDVLFQVYFHSQIAFENGEFNFYDITSKVTNKLIYRHPHVFKGLDYDPDRWDKLKDQEARADRTLSQRLENIKGLPSLLRGQKVCGKLDQVLDCFGDSGDILKDLEDTLASIREDLDQKSEKLEEDIGKLLYTIVILCYYLNISSEQTMNQVIDHVIGQVREMEKVAEKKNLDFQHLDSKDLKELWSQVRKIEK